MHLKKYRCVNSAVRAQSRKGLGCLVPLDHSLAVGDEFLGRTAFADLLTEVAISAPTAVTRGHQIPKSTEAIERLRPRAEGHPNPHHFCEGSGEQSRLRIVSQPEPVSAARRDRIDVLQAPTILDSWKVIARVNP